MKVIILFALFAASQAAVLLGGASEQFRTEDGVGNYAFGYNEGHGSGATFRRETGSPGVVSGSYGLSDADGRRRVVNYVADAAGFRANINTNEPGVEPKDPANTLINKAGVIAAPAVAHYAAPALHHAHPAPAAPLAHYAAPGLHHAPSALHYAGHPAGAFAYNSVVGHHGYAHPGHYGYFY
ncbi:cuticle protein 14-like [Parasteatoda tepidariorum]|uniref:cuticle protein 14-like n=1 Tax=Parasteatoda tepidariorum TaxID=114398 RepID=UPI001C71D073|nr:cuticle protein 14-like [Parasteatoda tepidariorum]